MSNKTLQIAVIAGALIIGVGLFLAKTVPDSPETLPTQSDADVQNEETDSEIVTGDDIDSQIDEAIALTQGEAPMKGILKLREIADNNPDNFRVYLELGAMSLQTGQYDKAIGRFNHIIDRDTTLLEAHYMLAATHLSLQDTAAALQSMEYVVQNAEDNSEFMIQGNNFIQQLLK